MADSVEITLWLDRRWKDAIEKQLKGETLEEYLEEVIDQLCNQLPEREYERISREIWREDQENKQTQEAARRFAVFHVTENGSGTYFLAKENIEMLQAASRLRNYIRRSPEDRPAQFTKMFSRSEKISLEQYDAYVHERMENTGRVTGAFDIDFDQSHFDALHIMDGWQCFRIQDVSTAAYFAMKKSDATQDERWKVFLDHLDGKQITHASEPGYISGSRPLHAEDISFAEDIIQNENLLEFYMEVPFDADAVFGTHVCTDENDDWLNIYANYDLEHGCVCDTLQVYLVRGDGGEQDFKYRLSDEEQALLLPKMEEYCQQHWLQSLDDCCAAYLSEDEQEQPEMQM